MSIIPRIATHKTTLIRISQIISNLLKCITDDREQKIQTKKVLETLELDFSVESYRTIRHDKHGEKPTISLPEAEKELLHLLVDRIIHEDSLSPLYKQFSSKTCKTCYWLWKEEYGSEALLKTLIKHFDNEPTNIDPFLLCFATKGHDLSDGHISYGFNQDNLKTVSQFINTDYIAKVLIDQYGDELENPNEYPSEEMPLEKQLAHQYMYWFKHEQNQ